MKRFRAYGRMVVFLFFTLGLILRCILASLIFGEKPIRNLRYRQQYVHRLFPWLGVEVIQTGTAPDYPCIVMCNHRSYLDPAVITWDFLGFPVTKAEVAKWPLIGYGIRVTGTLFVQRESGASRREALGGIAEKIKSQGFSIMLFPEGTTGAEPRTKPFRQGAFKLAAKEGIPIVPAAIEYNNPADYWVDDDSFIGHFLRRFGEPKIKVAISFGDAISSDQPEILSEATRQWIDQELILLKKRLQ